MHFCSKLSEICARIHHNIDPANMIMFVQLRISTYLVQIRRAVSDPLSPGFSPSVVSLFKHVDSLRIQHPVTALSVLQTVPRTAVQLVPRNFHKTIVQTQIVPYGVLPSLSVLPIIGEVVHDEPVDSAQREPLFRRRTDGHGDQGDVRIRRLLRPGLLQLQRQRERHQELGKVRVEDALSEEGIAAKVRLLHRKHFHITC